MGDLPKIVKLNDAHFHKFSFKLQPNSTHSVIEMDGKPLKGLISFNVSASARRFVHVSLTLLASEVDGELFAVVDDG